MKRKTEKNLFNENEYDRYDEYDPYGSATTCIYATCKYTNFPLVIHFLIFFWLICNLKHFVYFLGCNINDIIHLNSSNIKQQSKS